MSFYFKDKIEKLYTLETTKPKISSFYLIVGVDVNGLDECRLSDVRDQVEDLLKHVSDLMIHWELSVNNLEG